MQLSVSTSPAESTLAAPLLGSDVSGDPLTPGAAGASATPFAALYPGLASASAAGVTAVPAAPVAPAVPGAGADALTPWIGSTVPRPAVPPASPHGADPGAKQPAATPVERGPAGTPLGPPIVGVLPKAPAVSLGGPGPRPPARGVDRPAASAPRSVSEMAADLVPLLAAIPLAPSPAADLLSAATVAPDSDVDVSSGATTCATGETAESGPGARWMPAASIAPAASIPTAASSAAPATVGSSTGRAAGEGSSGFPAPPPMFVLSAAPAAAAGPVCAASVRPAGEVPVGAVPPAVTRDEPLSVADRFPAIRTEATPGVPSADTFAPSDILSRQFAAGSPPAVSPTVWSAVGSAVATPTPRAATSVPTDHSLSRPADVAPPISCSVVDAPAPTALMNATSPAAELVAGASDLASVVVPFSSGARREFVSSRRAEQPSAQRTANIAALAGKFSSAGNAQDNSAAKTFLSSSAEVVARGESDVGTGVAKPDPSMPAAFLNRSPSAAVVDHVPVAVGAAAPTERSANLAPSTVLAPEPAVAAQRAVEAVLTAAERFSAGDRHSVSLNFSVGGADLSVRVELRADEVHATFRTDSPELRSALASAWQAVNGAETGERSLRLATPVFTATSDASTSADLSSFAGGQGSSQQRETSARRGEAGSFEAAAARARGARVTSAGTDSGPGGTTSAVRPALSTAPHRLLTHA